MTDTPINFDTYQILAMYANGVHAADIGDRFGVTVQTIYKRMKEHPKEHAEAKKELAAIRNSKYRRAGAISIDKQLKYLDGIDDDQETLSKEMNTIIKIGEASEKRADLNEGKATEITKEIGTKFVVQMPEGFKGKNLK